MRPVRPIAPGPSRFIRPGMLPGLIALSLLGVTVAPTAAQDEGIAVGAVVEPFVIEDLAGSAVDLAEVIGKQAAVVQFWATWCPVCRVLDPKMVAAQERFGDDVAFLVIAVGVGQRKDQIATHIQRHPVAGRLLWDGEGAAVRAFEAPGTGYVVLLDAEGKVRWTGTGVDQDVEGAIQQLHDN